MGGLTIRERAALSAELQTIAQQTTDKPVVLPETCPVHPGEQAFDQDWIRRLVQIEVPLEALTAAILTGASEIFCQHLQRSVHVLQARGIPLARLHEMLDRLTQTVLPGLSHSGRDLVADLIAAGHACVDDVQLSPPGTYLRLPIPGQARFFEAILTGKRSDALRIVSEALEEGQAVMDICTDLFQTSLYEVGRLWELHQISVGQEHMATAVAQLAFSELAFRMGPHPSFRPRGCAVVMGMEDEFHQFASQMVAAFLEARGWEIRYWGTALPVSTVINFLRQEKPRLLCISLTMMNRLPALFKMLGQIRGDAEVQSMKVLVGGQAFQGHPDAAVPWGADASTPSLEQGLNLIEQWEL